MSSRAESMDCVVVVGTTTSLESSLVCLEVAKSFVPCARLRAGPQGLASAGTQVRLPLAVDAARECTRSAAPYSGKTSGSGPEATPWPRPHSGLVWIREGETDERDRATPPWSRRVPAAASWPPMCLARHLAVFPSRPVQIRGRRGILGPGAPI